MIEVYFIGVVLLSIVGCGSSFFFLIGDEMWDSKKEFGIWSFFTALGLVCTVLWPLVLTLALPVLIVYGLTIGAKYAKEEYL